MARPLTGWKRRFDDPVPLAGGRQLVTLEDAAGHIQGLPAAEHDQAHWQFAVDMLIRAAEREPGWILFARMAFLQALHHGAPAPRQPGPRRKPAKRYNIVPAAPRRPS